jgi:hypothetical protein
VLSADAIFFQAFSTYNWLNSWVQNLRWTSHVLILYMLTASCDWRGVTCVSLTHNLKASLMSIQFLQGKPIESSSQATTIIPPTCFLVFVCWLVSRVLVFVCLFVLSFQDKVSLHSPCWPWTHYVAQAGLELKILLLQPPDYWDCRHVTPCPTCHLLFTWGPSRSVMESPTLAQVRQAPQVCGELSVFFYLGHLWGLEKGG